MKQMSLQHGVLGFLNYSSMSGYDLAKAFSSSVQFFWNAQNSQIYLVLDKLEKQGFVTHKLIVQTDKPSKKLYSITEACRTEFLRWLAAPNESISSEFKSAFLMKVFFSGNRTSEESIEMFRAFINDCCSVLDSMGSIPDSIQRYSEGLPDEAPLYWQFDADFGYSYLKMCIEWAEKCIEKLEAMK